MSKLKIYEINSLVNVITKRVNEGIKKDRDERVEEIKRENRDLIEKYEEKVVELNNLLGEVEVLEKKLVDLVKNDDKISLVGGGMRYNYEYEGKVIKRDNYFYSSEDEIRNEVIISNLEGNVSGMIDEIVSKFIK
jgi:hypothetical protein